MAQNQLTRRALIQVAAVAAVAPPGLAAATPKFFSPAEFAMLDELAEMIVPADDHSPGARTAGVAAYLDARLAESVETDQKKQWHDGLQRIEALSLQLHGKPFLEATPSDRVSLLSRIAANENNPQTPDNHFFLMLKFNVADAYYSSKIGIHQEMEYKGNVLLPEFVGYEVK